MEMDVVCQLSEVEKEVLLASVVKPFGLTPSIELMEIIRFEVIS
jgi:hypothetical protein